MILPTLFRRCALVLLAAAVTVPAASPARARIFVGFGLPYPAYYYPGPYYGYTPYYYPYYAPPPVDYVPPAAVPGPATYPSPTGASPSSVSVEPLPPTVPRATASVPPGYSPNPAGGGTAPITYTSKPAFTNAAGQLCREYRATDTSSGRPVDVYGTACRSADGSWRVTE